MKALARLLLLFLVSLAHAAERQPEEFYDPDVQQLLSVRHFAFGPVGDGGNSVSAGEVAFGRIVRKPGAIRYLLAAFEHGEIHAQCYALVGLRESSPEFFRAALAMVRKNPSVKINTLGGCLMWEADPLPLFAEIEAGAYAELFKLHEQWTGATAWPGARPPYLPRRQDIFQFPPEPLTFGPRRGR